MPTKYCGKKQVKTPTVPTCANAKLRLVSKTVKKEIKKTFLLKIK